MFNNGLVVVIPALNECASIGQAIQSIKALEAELRQQGLELQVFVVDDGSTDATGAIAERHGANQVIRHRRNRGLGASVRAGLSA